MAFFRQRLSGFSGGTLEEQLAQALQQGQSQMLAPTNTAAITRPRTVAPSDSAISTATPRMRDMLAKQAAEPLTINTPRPTDETLLNSPAMRETQPNVQLAQEVNGEPFGARPRRTQMRDYVADDAAYLRDLERQPRNWKDKTVDAIRALNTNFNGPSASPPTKRERELARAQGSVTRDIAVEKSQTASALGDLVPVQLEDGRIVMTPARSAGTLSSQQQAIKTRNDTAKAHVARWKQMGKHEAVQDALRVYNSGGANDPETLAAISDTLELPKDLKPKFIAGEIVAQADENGVVQLINKRDNTKVSTGVKTYETTKEAGRDERAREQRKNSRGNALIMAGQRAGEKGDPEEFERLAKDADADAKYADDEAANLQSSAYASDKQTARQYRQEAEQHKRQARELRIKATQAKGAQGSLQGTPKSGRTIDGAIKAFTKQVGRPPTADEIVKMKAALGQ